MRVNILYEKDPTAVILAPVQFSSGKSEGV